MSIAKIKMDYRERDSGLAEILALKYEMEVITESLKSGDFIIDGEVVIERKTAPDFIESIIDGRLFKQAALLRKFFAAAAFIVEGRLGPALKHMHPHAIQGALTSLAIGWQMPVLFAENQEDTALLLWLISNQRNKMSRQLSYRPGQRPKRLRKRQLYILQGLPQVGPKLADQLLERFGTVEKVMSASENALLEILRLGKIKARKIREVLTQY